MKDTIVFYHGGYCADGFGAALAAWLKLGERADYIPVNYSEAPVPDVSGKDVYILDFSFSDETMLALSRQARSLTLLDHHTTAEKRLSNFKPLCCGKIHFDMHRSGAVLAWEFFHPDIEVPQMFRYIQDRDLWRWQEEGSRPFLAWLGVQPFDFQVWADVLKASPADMHRMIEQGEGMLLQFDALCRSAAAQAEPLCLAGIEGLAINTAGDLRSEAGGLMAATSGTFGLVWRVTKGKVLCSLRSNAPFNVEALAAKFGGGGHEQAAAFTLPLERLPELVSGRLDPLPACKAD